MDIADEPSIALVSEDAPVVSHSSLSPVPTSPDKPISVAVGMQTGPDREMSANTCRGVSITGGEHPLARLEATAGTTQIGDQTEMQTCSSPTSPETGAAAGTTQIFISQAQPDSSQLRPTPWPVTSTCSLEDWSTLPRLGFPPSKSAAVREAEAAARAGNDAIEARNEAHWYARCRGVSLLASASPETVESLRRYASRYGLPRHLRGVMWFTLTGMALKVDENEYYCLAVLRRNGYVQGSYGAAIAADLERTFPGHPYFSNRDVGLYKLNNVLHALCWRNPLLSYCQSFNFLAAFILLVLDDEERSFWILLHVMETLLPNDFYSESLRGAKVDQVVLERLTKKNLPRLAAKFEAVGFDVGALIPAWMMSLFVNTFPAETTLRVWDYMLVEAPQMAQKTSAHLEVTLAMLRFSEEALMHCEDAGEVLLCLQQRAAVMFDAEKLLRAARSLAISPERLHRLRLQVKPLVTQEIQDREALHAYLHERRVTRALRYRKEADEALHAAASPTESALQDAPALPGSFVTEPNGSVTSPNAGLCGDFHPSAGETSSAPVPSSSSEEMTVIDNQLTEQW